VGWAQLAKASDYAGDPCTVGVQFAEQAYRLGPTNPDALLALGSRSWATWCGGRPIDPRQGILLLERALELDPTIDDARIRLWVMRLAQGRREAAEGELRWLLDHGRIPEPLVDYGYNELVGLEPDAILLTNGDNDTYPALALQIARGFRPDVVVVNLSMLNLGWYRRMLSEGRRAIPVPLLDQGPGACTGSDEALRGLITNLTGAGWKRPLYAACTVDMHSHAVPNRLSLEGLVYRVLPTGGSGMEADTVRLARNLRSTYRVESATSPGLDWEAWSSLHGLMLNYATAEMQLAMAHGRADDKRGVTESMSRALALCEFHHAEHAEDLLKAWEEIDPTSRDLAMWAKRLRK
jgi:hypothetical protein